MKNNLVKILLVSLFLGGCINYEQVTTIHGDNSGNMYIHYWAKVKLPIDSTIFTRVSAFNKNEIGKVFNSENVQLKNVEVYLDEGDSSLHGKIEFDFKNFNELNKLKPFEGSRLAITDVPGGNKKFTQFVKPFTLPFIFDSEKYWAEYTYYLPGNILYSNAQETSLNKLYWKFRLNDLQNGKILTATFRPFRLSETPRWIYYLAGFVILVVMFFLFSKKSS